MENAPMQQVPLSFICNSSSSPALQLQIFFFFFFFSTGKSAALFRELTLYHTHATQALCLLIQSRRRCSIGRLLPRQWWCAAARILTCTRMRLVHARPWRFFHLLHGTFRHGANHPKITGKGWGRHGGLGVRCVWGDYLPTLNLHQNLLTQIKSHSQLLHLHRRWKPSNRPHPHTTPPKKTKE